MPELYLVSPRVDVRDEEVIRFSAKARDYIDHVKIVNSFSDSLKDIDLIACTSAIIPVKRDPLRQAIELRDLIDIASNYRSFALVFGRESTGLTREELEKCSLYIHIRAGREYPVLNLSHSIAIALYTIFDLYSHEGSIEKMPIDKNIVERIISRLNAIFELLDIDKQRMLWIAKSVERLIYSSKSSNSDLLNILYLFNRIYNRLRRP